MVIASIVRMKHAPQVTSTPIAPPPWKKKRKEKERYFQCGHKIFAIIFAPFVSFGFWSHFFPSCSCLPCPLKYVVLCMSPLNTSANWHTVYYQESNFLKKTLFIVFGVKLRILLHLHSDWLRAVQFFFKQCRKELIQCKKRKQTKHS